MVDTSATSYSRAWPMERRTGGRTLQKIVEVCPSGIIAEDLGIIPKSIHDMRKRHSIPGMAVLQFSNEDPGNPHHPDNHRKDTVAYTGTHDNNTTVGWGNIPVEDMIISAMTSPAGLCVIPIQDVLQLGSEARMNTPERRKATGAGHLSGRSWNQCQLSGSERTLLDFDHGPNHAVPSLQTNSELRTCQYFQSELIFYSATSLPQIHHHW